VAGIAEAIPRLHEALAAAGLALDDIDYLIPHQTSARAIEKGSAEFASRLGGEPKHVVITVDEFGNTASTTHFVALWKYLTDGRLRHDDRVLLLSLASGLVVGVVIFTVGELVERYAQMEASHGHGR
jgi:3-oxoacyl-[acyl-carrier-protein] synthase-3